MNTNTFQIPFEDFGGEGPILHFAHANGFPPNTYQRFLKPFTKSYKVIGVNQRPLWQEKPNATSNWHQVSEDLIHFLDSQNLKNIVGMGHSMGAVATLFASIKRPDLFSHLILIEPVFIPPKQIFLFSLTPSFLQKKMNPMIKGALRRQDVWENREAVFESWRRKRVFSKWSDEVLWDYVNAATKPNKSGQFELTYSKYWEANYYGRVPKIWGDLKKATHPMMGIRGAKTNTLFPEAWKKWKSLQPNATFLEMEDVGHLVPMEEPALISEKILAFLKN
ncbi:MAG: alpha/beta hydrolase [Saprospiraceae bacterium]|nr:alpha/beta hydrolase [Saprospiraceae bacterium]